VGSKNVQSLIDTKPELQLGRSVGSSGTQNANSDGSRGSLIQMPLWLVAQRKVTINKYFDLQRNQQLG